MILITSSWNNYKTFRLIPMVNNSAFAEGIFDPETKTLAMMSRQTAEAFRMIPKLDVNGEVVKSKVPRSNGKLYQEERKVITSHIEYYVTEREEIVGLLDRLADNSSSFDIFQYLDAEKPQPLGKESALRVDQ